MKTCYVGVGGIGCKALKQLSLRMADRQDVKFLYFDTDQRSDPEFDAADRRYVFKDYPYGTGCMRSLGKDMFRKLLYTDQIPDFVDDFFRTDELLLCLVTTTFGGFGSAVVFELADYLSARILSRGKAKVSVRVIAFTQELYRSVFPKELMQVHEINTLEFVSDYQYRSARKSLFFPDMEMYAIYADNLTVAKFPDIVTLPPEILSLMDTKHRYQVKPATRRTAGKDVFISFSSADENVANAITDALQEHQISAWNFRRNMGGGHYPEQIVQAIRGARVFVVVITKNSLKSVDVMSEVNLAYRRVLDGMIIMPFLADDTPMSDNFEYYLGAHNCFDGKQPPLAERIRLFVDGIRNVLDN